MGDVVNLNRFRKQKARVDRGAEAERNRRVHGRTAAERAEERTRREREAREIDGKHLDDAPSSPQREGEPEQAKLPEPPGPNDAD